MDQLLQCKAMLNTISFLIDQLPFAHMDHVIISQRAGPKLDQGKCEASEMCALERPSPDFCPTSVSIFPPTEGFI